MPWVAQDDHFFHNPKARAVGPYGRELFAASWCYCSIQLNDGCFIAEDAPVIAVLAQVPPDIADLLYGHGLWHPEGADCAKCRVVGQVMPVPAGHVAVHEYLKQNKTRAQVLAEREANAERQRRLRASRRDKPRESRPPQSQSPDGFTTSSRPTTPTDTEETRPDDGLIHSQVPDECWQRYAELKLQAELKRGAVKNSNHTKWKATTRRNAKLELGEQAAGWLAEFDVAPRDLAAWLIDGKPSPYAKRRGSTDGGTNQ